MYNARDTRIAIVTHNLNSAQVRAEENKPLDTAYLEKYLEEAEAEGHSILLLQETRFPVAIDQVISSYRVIGPQAQKHGSVFEHGTAVAVHTKL